MFTDFILTTPRHFARLHAIAPHAKLATTVDELSGGDHLAAFSSGVIVPSEVLSTFKWAYNFHGAPPSYPGRDPHHWAAYDRARTFGAVAHVMHARVDAGPIVGGLTFGMPKDASPALYRDRAEIALYALFETLAPMMFQEGLPPIGVEWSGRKRSRADLIAMCNMSDASAEEIDRRKFAFHGFEAMFT